MELSGYCTCTLINDNDLQENDGTVRFATRVLRAGVLVLYNYNPQAGRPQQMERLSKRFWLVHTQDLSMCVHMWLLCFIRLIYNISFSFLAAMIDDGNWRTMRFELKLRYSRPYRHVACPMTRDEPAVLTLSRSCHWSKLNRIYYFIILHILLSRPAWKKSNQNSFPQKGIVVR